MDSSRSSSSIDQRRDSVVVCNCNSPAKITRAWTVKNPGRRFYACRGRKSGNGYENCNFFEWFDIEKPHGWQHEALLEARDVLNRQREEIKNLKVIVGSTESESGREELNREMVDETKHICVGCEKLNREMLILNERSIVYRNVLIASSLGFTIAIGAMMAFWKN